MSCTRYNEGNYLHPSHLEPFNMLVNIHNVQLALVFI